MIWIICFVQKLLDLMRQILNLFQNSILNSGFEDINSNFLILNGRHIEILYIYINTMQTKK